MARYIREVTLNRPADFVQFIMTDFLSKHGFSLVKFKGEMVYRTGGGLLEIPKFLTWGYRNGIFHVEAWTRNLWLPGVYGRECLKILECTEIPACSPGKRFMCGGRTCPAMRPWHWYFRLSVWQ